ncbi:CRAL-TRIO domain-containing protein [Mucidula mucida]|nr:CRAL-TRIO domain-containing protein [Mucidula mucida]
MATVTITQPVQTTVTLVSMSNDVHKPAPGRLGNLTDTQSKALDTLKTEIKAEGWFVEERMDDHMLLRFLRARKFDVALAKKMLKECEEWRKEFGIDELMKTFEFKEKAEVDKYYPQYYHRMDKDGQPIYIERLGKLDMKALYAATTQERVIQRLVYEYERFLTERIPACTKTVGRPVETSCTILDLHNVSLSNFVAVKDYVKQASAIGQNRYPECMGKFYIINAPWAFSTVWRLSSRGSTRSPSARLISSARITRPSSGQIPKESLPKEFGGSCECPGGCSLSDAGPWNESSA